MAAKKEGGAAMAPLKNDADQADKLTGASPETVESGALQELEIAQRIDTAHPAVDDKPREGLPPESNQIDFNDPRPIEVVRAEAQKAAQG